MSDRPGVDTAARHELKCWPPFFADVDEGRKPFELRYDDRAYAVGDELWLREWTGTGYSGRECIRTVTYVLRDAEMFGLQAGSVVLGLDNTPALSVALEAARQETASERENAGLIYDDLVGMESRALAAEAELAGLREERDAALPP